jgi:hypothetical protein
MKEDTCHYPFCDPPLLSQDSHLASIVLFLLAIGTGPVRLVLPFLCTQSLLFLIFPGALHRTQPKRAVVGSCDWRAVVATWFQDRESVRHAIEGDPLSYVRESGDIQMVPIVRTHNSLFAWDTPLRPTGGLSANGRFSCDAVSTVRHAGSFLDNQG